MTKVVQKMQECLNIDRIGPDGKFVHFVRYKADDPTCPDKIEIKEDVVHFTSDAYDQENLSPIMRLQAFERMIKSLEKGMENLINSEIEKEIYKLRYEITKKLKDKFRLDDLKLIYNKKKANYESIKQEISEASLTSSEPS